jgi:hypothetical protein
MRVECVGGAAAKDGDAQIAPALRLLGGKGAACSRGRQTEAGDAGKEGPSIDFGAYQALTARITFHGIP